MRAIGAERYGCRVEETSSRSNVRWSVAAFALAATAVVALSVHRAAWFHTESAESIAVLAWLLGWLLLACAVIVTGVSLIAVLRRVFYRRPVPLVEAAVLCACVVLIVIAITMAPMWGTGSGQAIGFVAAQGDVRCESSRA